ncbi:hypothetical protein AAMO2058_001758100 [Amorphochlora amoebiformis]
MESWIRMFCKILRRMETWGNCVEDIGQAHLCVRIPGVLGPQHGCVVSRPGEEHLWEHDEKEVENPAKRPKRNKTPHLKASAMDADENANASDPDGNLSESSDTESELTSLNSTRTTRILWSGGELTKKCIPYSRN